MLFVFDLSELSKFDKKTLQKLKTTAFPFAVKNTLNSAAFEIRSEMQTEIKNRYTLRNAFTEKSIRVAPIKTLKIEDMISSTGSIAPYMSDQESGKKLISGGKYGVRIPTPASADQDGSKRTKPIKPRHRRGKIKLNDKIDAKSKAQFILMSIRVAGLRGQSPYVFLPLEGAAGLYKVIPKGAPLALSYRRGGKKIKRSNKWGRPRGTPGKEKIVMIHSFEHKSVDVPATHMLEKTAEKIVKKLPEIFEKKADEQVKRLTK